MKRRIAKIAALLCIFGILTMAPAFGYSFTFRIPDHYAGSLQFSSQGTATGTSTPYVVTDVTTIKTVYTLESACIPAAG